MKMLIRNMVNEENRATAGRILAQLGLNHLPIVSEEVEITGDPAPASIVLLREALAGYGLELMEDKKSLLIEKIKNRAIEMVRDGEKPLKTNFSNYLSSSLLYDYTYMANLFSKVQGMTIERYVILLKIEKVKELLILGQLTLTEISYKLHYSSVAHLSNQFKKVTGYTPSHFKQNGNQAWLSPENV